MKFSVLLVLVSATVVNARPPISRRAVSPAVALQNGQDAIALKYVTEILYDHDPRLSS